MVATLQHNLPISEKERLFAEAVRDGLSQSPAVEITHLKAMYACDVALAPSRRLPIEVVQEIALFCMPEKTTASTRDAPVSLSRVCATWRQAILSFPRLWSRLAVSLSCNKGHEQMTISRFFERARNTSLTLMLTLFPGDSYDFPRARELLSWLFYGWGYISQVRDFTLKFGFRWDELYSSNGIIAFDSLESLTLFNHSNYRRPFLREKSLLDIFHHTPQLRNLVIDRAIFSTPLPHFGHWSVLEHLVLGTPISHENYTALVDACINLQTAHFYLDLSGDWAQFDSPPNFAKQLYSLTVVFVEYDIDFLDAFRSRVFPSLTHVEMKFTGTFNVDETKPWKATADVMPSDLRDYLPTLTHLAIYDLWNFPIHFPSFILEYPTLTSFLINLQPGGLVPFLDLLSSERSVCLPHLTELEISFLGWSEEEMKGVNIENLTSLFRLRTGDDLLRREVAQLRVGKLQISAFLERHIAKDLMELEKAVFSFCVTRPPPVAPEGFNL